MRSEPTDLIQSVSRALRVLEQVAQAERPLPVKVIARRCGLNLSTAYHLIRTLCYEGYLIRQADGTYALGSELAQRFHELIFSFQRPPSAAAALRHLAAVGQHTAYLARMAADRMVIVDVVEGPRSPWLEDLQVGLETAAHATALGKSLLTTLPRRTRRRVLSTQGMHGFTRNTRTDLATVERELRDLAPGDVVIERGEFRDEVACASIVTPAGGTGDWWAVGVSARGLDLSDQLLTHLRLAATDIGRRAGGAGDRRQGAAEDGGRARRVAGRGSRVAGRAG
ncbi:MAG TPA: helix-turn-helix domain-containing protein [Jiangellales bacterium]|nr:helix-turn-helix domain-containing protein [Jiangellales bacterium]